MAKDPILNHDSVFGDAPVRRAYMGRSALAVIMACVISLFIVAPIAMVLGAGSNLVIFPELSTTEDEYLGGLIFVIFGCAVFVLTVAGMILNKFRNYATNIMGITYVIAFILGFSIVAGVYYFGGPEALL